MHNSISCFIKLWFSSIALLFVFNIQTVNIYGQCNTNTNFYPTSSYTPIAGIWSSATTFNYAGDIIKINVISGDTYEFSTCSTHGGVGANYNTELTLRDQSGNLLIYNDDYTGCGTASYINWNSTITGEVHLHLNVSPCASNSIDTEVRIQRTIGGGIGSNYCGNSNSPADDPCNAPSIDLSQAYYGSTNCNYTVSSGGSSPGPDDFASCGGGATSNNDSWLLFTAADDTASIDWNITNCANNLGVQFAVFDGSCLNEDAMVQLACFNPSGVFQTSGTFTIPNLSIGQNYYIYIDGYSGDLCDYYWLAQEGVAMNPINDSCQNAITINCGNIDTSNNILATNNDAPASCGGLNTGQGVWYKYIGDGSNVMLSTSSTATNFDTEIFVYSGICSNLTCIGSDNDSGSGTTSEFTFSTTIGTDYYIYVDGNGTSIGQFVLNTTCLCSANAGTWN